MQLTVFIELEFLAKSLKVIYNKNHMSKNNIKVEK